VRPGAILAGMVPPKTNAEMCEQRAKRLARDGYCVRCGREKAAPKRTACNPCLDRQIERARLRTGRPITDKRCSRCHEPGHTNESCERRGAA
jgi:hypothetical protein